MNLVRDPMTGKLYEESWLRLTLEDRIRAEAQDPANCCARCHYFDADVGIAGYGKCKNTRGEFELENHPWPHADQGCKHFMLRRSK